MMAKRNSSLIVIGVLSTLLLSLNACGGSNIEVDSAVDQEASFARYRIWAVAGPEALPEGFARLDLPILERERLRELAGDILAEKGYREGTINNADIIFFVGVGQRRESTVTREATYRSSDGGYETTVGRYEQSANEDTLVIDGFERPSMFHVFHGQSTVSGVQDDVAAVEQALRAILVDVPATDPSTEAWTSGGEEPPAEDIGATDEAVGPEVAPAEDEEAAAPVE